MGKEYKTEEICNLRMKAEEELREAFAMSGTGAVSCDIPMALADIIKDLAEAEKNIHEACYYKTVAEAMEEAKEPEMFGYNRYKEMSRPIPGWRPMIDNIPYADGTIDDSNGRMGYSPEDYPNHDMIRHGRAVSEYKKSKRRYTQNGSLEDKAKMNQNTEAYVNDMVMNLREMYHDADPEHRRVLLSNVEAMLNEMRNVK